MRTFAHSLIILSLTAFIPGMSCRKADPEGYEIYRIPKGKHSSTRSVTFFKGDALNFTAKFDSSAIYTSADPSNQEDINKLYGFSDCSSQHHTNSARFGWRWFNNELQIFAYCYTEKERNFTYITSIEMNRPYDFSLSIRGESYIFTCNGSTVTMARGCSENGTKYLLYPYFGGNETAPHEIEILVLEDGV